MVDEHRAVAGGQGAVMVRHGGVVASQCPLPPPPEHRLPVMAIAMGMEAFATFLPALQSTGKVRGRSLRIRFLKDAIPRCSAEGEMPGRGPGGCIRKESTRSAWLVVFLQPFVISAAGEDELKHSPARREQLTQLGEGQRQPSPSPSPAGGQCRP